MTIESDSYTPEMLMRLGWIVEDTENEVTYNWSGVCLQWDGDCWQIRLNGWWQLAPQTLSELRQFCALLQHPMRTEAEVGFFKSIEDDPTILDKLAARLESDDIVE